jgi:hypothetical protein
VRCEGYKKGGVVEKAITRCCEARNREPCRQGRERVVVPVRVVCEGGCCEDGAEVIPRGYKIGCLLSSR